MVEPSQGAGLVQEPVQAPVVVLGIRAGLRHHRVPLCPGGKLTWQVLLDGHELVEIRIISPVGDTEAPGAQDRGGTPQSGCRVGGRSRGRWAWMAAGPWLQWLDGA